jgi:hypothetical protein
MTRLLDAILSAYAAVTGRRFVSISVPFGATGYRKKETPMSYKYFNVKDDPMIIGVDEKTMRLADAARERSGIPWTVTSGKRTPDQNAADANSVKDSAHLTGQALDIRCTDYHQFWAMVFGLMNTGARRMGIYFKTCSDNPTKLIPTHLHIDTDPDKPQEIFFATLEK